MSSATSSDRVPVWLSQQQAADYLGVTDRTVRNYIARGDLKGHRAKGSRIIRIHRDDLDAFLRPIPTNGGGRVA